MTPFQLSWSITADPAWPWSVPGIGWAVLSAVCVALVALTVWTYWGAREAGPARVAAVVVLRLLALAVAVLLALRPALAIRDQTVAPYTVLLLADGSASMSIRDEYDNQSRWDYALRLLKDAEPTLRGMEDEVHATVARYRFAENLTEFKEDAAPDGRRTDFGRTLRTLYERHGHERDIRCVIVLSDGADNGTRFAALAEAAAWRGLGVPIETFGLGKPGTADRQRDIVVTNVTAHPSPVAVKTMLGASAAVDAPGFENATVTAHLLVDDKEVASKRVTLGRAVGNEVQLETDAPDKPGEVKVTLKIDPLPGEASTANNEMSTFVTVTKEGLSVLVVDKPRYPEPQLICDALAADPRVRLYAVWIRGDQPAADEADLFDFDKRHYDVVLLGDVSASRLQRARPGALERLRDLVAKGGTGLGMTGGYDSFGNSDWQMTPLEHLSPVQLDVSGQAEGLWQMRPTGAGLSHYVMRLADNPDANAALWNHLPKLDGYTRLGTPKGGATVLATSGEGTPVLVSQAYGDGRTLGLAADTTWRWMRLGQPTSTEGIDAHAHFWKQIVFWLAKRDAAEGTLWVTSDTRRLPAGGRLGFRTGLRGKGGLDLADGEFEARVTGPKGETPVAVARDAGGHAGTFWKTDAPGEYRLTVRAKGKDADGQPLGPVEASARFIVYDDDTEMSRRAADYGFLTRLASATGGRFRRADELPQFLQDLKQAGPAVSQSRAEYLPDWRETGRSGFRVIAFALFAGLLCAEWLLRRWWGMV